MRRRGGSVRNPVRDIVAALVFGETAYRIVKALGLDEKAAQAHLHINPVILVSRALMRALYHGFFVAVIAYIVANAFPSAALFAIAVAILYPLALVLAPILAVSSAASSRLAKIANELPFLSIHMSVLAGAGLPAPAIVDHLVSTGLYPEASKELRRAVTLSKTMGVDLVTALDEVSKQTPHPLYRQLLRGFVTALRMRTNPAEFLSRFTDTVVEEFRARAESARSFAAAIGTVFGMLNIVFVFVAVMAVGGAIPGLEVQGVTIAYAGSVSVPAVTMLLTLLLHRKVPKLYTVPAAPILLAFTKTLPVSVLASIPVHMLLAQHVPDYAALAVAATVALAPAAIAAGRMYSKTVEEEEAVRRFLDFLHTLASERRQGLPLEHIIETMPLAYGGLNKAVARLKASFRMGMPPEKSFEAAFADYRSPIMRFMARLLSDAVVLGAATDKVLTQLEELLTALVDVVDKVRRELKSTAVTPYVMFGVAAATLSLYTSMIGGLHAAVPTIPGQPQVPAEVVEAAMSAITFGFIVNAVAAGAMVGVMRGQTPLAGFNHIALLLAITVAALVLPAAGAF